MNLQRCSAKPLALPCQEAGVSVAYILSMEFLQLSQSRSGKDDPNFYDLKVAGLPKPCGVWGVG